MNILMELRSQASMQPLLKDVSSPNINSIIATLLTSMVSSIWSKTSSISLH